MADRASDTGQRRPGEGKVAYLHSEGLLSKWGFGDGDCLDDDLWDLADIEGVSTTGLSEQKVLIRAVREYLLPALDQKVEVYEIGTNHNPIRAATIDGVGVPDEVIYGDQESPWTLTPDHVTVPLDVLWEWYVTAIEEDEPDGE